MNIRLTGIYYIKCKVTGAIYIGKSENIYRRFNRHKYELCRNNHKNMYLQRAYNKYGEDSFIWGIIEECNSADLNFKERYYIKLYKDMGNILYNMTDGGDGGKMPDYIIERVKVKISMANRGNPKLRHCGSDNGMYGKHHTDITKAKISKNRKGKPSWTLGKHLSQETRAKIGAKNKGKKLSDVSKAKISMQLKGKLRLESRSWSNELCREIRNFHMIGISYYKLGKLLGKNPETVRYSIRRYEVENCLNNSSDNMVLLPVSCL